MKSERMNEKEHCVRLFNNHHYHSSLFIPSLFTCPLPHLQKHIR